jgi:DNA-binding NarL/FixJ family response regulator
VHQGTKIVLDCSHCGLGKTCERLYNALPISRSEIPMLTDLHDGRGGNAGRAPAILTDREQQVAALVRKGLSNKLIARALNVREGTIKAHLHAIFGKLGVRSRFALINDRLRVT